MTVLNPLHVCGESRLCEWNKKSTFVFFENIFISMVSESAHIFHNYGCSYLCVSLYRLDNVMIWNLLYISPVVIIRDLLLFVYYFQVVIKQL